MKPTTGLPPLIAALLCAAMPAAAQETPPASGETPAAADPADAARAARLKRMADEKEERDAQAALLTSRAAVGNAESAVALSKFGALGSYKGADGEVEVDSQNRSEFETNLLSAAALDRAGDIIGRRLCAVVFDRSDADSTAKCEGRRVPAKRLAAPAAVAQTGRIPSVSAMDRAALCAEAEAAVLLAADLPPSETPVVIVAQAPSGGTDLADVFAIRTAALGRAFCRALADADANEEVAGGSLAAIGTAVSTIANLFRADYRVYGVELTIDQSLLTKRVAQVFMDMELPNPVYLPGLSPVAGMDAGNPALRRLALLDGLRALAVAHANYAAQPRLAATVKAYDDVLAALTQSDGDQPPLMATIVRQARLAALLRRGAYLVVTNVHMMGGTAYTKKNFFTAFGGMPYFVSGGALASYLVQDGATGQTLDSVTVPVTSGYHRANAIGGLFPGTPQERPAR